MARWLIALVLALLVGAALFLFTGIRPSAHAPTTAPSHAPTTAADPGPVADPATVPPPAAVAPPSTAPPPTVQPPTVQPSTAPPSTVQPSTSDPRTAVSGAIARPMLGSSVIRVPATMKQGREAIAQLIVSPTELGSLLAQVARTAGDGDVRATAEQVRLQPRMRASLSAPGFDVAPDDAQEQVVKTDEPTVWIWTLVPSERGRRTLVFTLEGIVVVDGRETALRPPALLVPVEVDIDPLLLVEKYWQWLTTVLVVPLAVFFGRRWLDRRSAPPKPS